MARARMLSASISNSQKLADLSCDSARLLYTWLIPHADNLGRLRGEPVHVKAVVLPRTPAKVEQVDKWLGELARVGLIRWYIHQNERFIVIDGWASFQKLHHTAARNSELPDPDAQGCEVYGDLTVNSRLANGEVTRGSRPEVEVEGEVEGEQRSHQRAVDDVRVLREWLEAFDQHFWPAYPRKVSKAEALVAWRKFFTSGKGMPEHEALLGRIVGGLGWYCEDEWRDRALDKIPHAATWLNQKRWEDAFDGTQAQSAAE